MHKIIIRTAIGVLVHSEIARHALRCVWAPEHAHSHADLFVPLNRIEADESSPEWVVQVVSSLHVLVSIATEFLN
jgi:hypothetical protein